MRVIGSYTRDTSTETTSAAHHAAKTGKGRDAKGSTSASASASAGAVKVSLSDEAKELSSSSAASSSSDIDTAKVDRLKSAIDSGSFAVDSSKIASKIVDED